MPGARVEGELLPLLTGHFDAHICRAPESGSRRRGITASHSQSEVVTGIWLVGTHRALTDCWRGRSRRSGREVPESAFLPPFQFPLDTLVPDGKRVTWDSRKGFTISRATYREIGLLTCETTVDGHVYKTNYLTLRQSE